MSTLSRGQAQDLRDIGCFVFVIGLNLVTWIGFFWVAFHFIRKYW